MQDRKTLIERVVARRTFTIVIIGAGINGIATFRDLGLQGIDCLIVDKGDFCAGASSASSRVIHGGLKYLETGEFRLVAEAIIERNRLVKNAPHVVRPLEIILLFHSWWGGSVAAVKRFFGWPGRLGKRGVLIVKIGLGIFDFLGRRERATPRYKFQTRTNILRSMPAIDPQIVAGASYFDTFVTQPERLGLELVHDAMNSSTDCIGLNYIRLLLTKDGILEFRDEIGGRVFEIQPTIVVNATGAWIDFTNETMGIGHRYIGGTKGSHLVLDNAVLHEQLAGRMVSFDGADGRECFVYPLLGMVLLGTTDLYVDDPDEARCGDSEIDYLLEALQAAFQGIDIGRDNVVFTYCGVRPLPYAGAGDPSQVTRDHSVRIDKPSEIRPYPVFSLVGGKWTTFRAFAEETTDLVLGALGRARQVGTRELPIGGGLQFPKNEQALNTLLGGLTTKFDISGPRAAILVERYGSKASAVAAYCNGRPDQPIADHCSYTSREIAYLASNEMVGHVLDILLRRTTIAISGQSTAMLVKKVAAIVGDMLGWDEARTEDEIVRTITELYDRHGVDVHLLTELATNGRSATPVTNR